MRHTGVATTPPDDHILAFFGGMADPARRPAAVEALARSLGLRAILLFIDDPEVGALIPAPGFPQTLQGGREWRAFLAECVRNRFHHGEIPFPFSASSGASSSGASRTRVHGCAADDGSVLLLLGEGATREVCEALRPWLTMLTAAFHLERASLRATQRAAAAEEIADRARTLASGLDTARRQVQRALQEAESARARASLLAEVGALLTASLESESTLLEVARIVVPRCAELCVIDVTDDSGDLQTASSPADAAGSVSGARLAKTFPGSATRREMVLHALSSGEPSFVADVTSVAPGEREHRSVISGDAPGEPDVASLAVVPLLARGRTLGVLTFASSSAARRLTQDDFILAQEIGARMALAIDNARLYQRAQRAIHARDEFLSIASHELCNPLAAMCLQAESLQVAARKQVPDVPPPIVEKIGALRKQINRLRSLVADLLDVSKISAGRLSLAFEEVDLGAVVQDVVENMSDAAAHANSPIDVRVEPGVVGVWDRTRIEQVARNLVSNAIKYGNGQPIEIIAGRSALGARIVVRDHGIGIPSEHLTRIFDRFERVSTKSTIQGLGLGLFITRQIIEAHRGTTTVTSELNRGSVFTVELPLRPTPLPARVSEPASHSS